ncbi:hypothetical protein C5167_042193 [Papaver somniferum]|uniref:BED-type domain-containing protein n=1 Tax=Papaver somniferum TaxID=3469 RepID=A0A4Y7L3U4_PAPSO|nr:hypothetical protein C5167_042193 [Papaver somniferum]
MLGSSSTPTVSVSSNKRPPRPRPAPNASSVGGASAAKDASTTGDASGAGDASADGDATEADIEVTETKGKKRTSNMWNHFDMEPQPSKYARCHHWKTKIAAQGVNLRHGKKQLKFFSAFTLSQQLHQLIPSCLQAAAGVWE